MKMIKYIALSVAIMILSSMVSCKDNGSNAGKDQISVYKIAVILPASEKERWTDVGEWAMNNMNYAQNSLSRKVQLMVEWLDEDAPGWEENVKRVVGTKDVVAVIGPKSSVKAEKVAEMCRPTQKTLILPVATSTEFQRCYAGCNFVWNLSQSDITQCELLLSQVKMSERNEVSLLAPDNYYGKSFIDWFSFQAVELGLKVNSINIYYSEDDIRNVVQDQYSLERVYNKALIFVPGCEKDALVLDDELYRLSMDAGWNFDFPLLLCSDMMNSSVLFNKFKFHSYEGLYPSATPESGFDNLYRIRFGREPICGEAHLFDAVSLLVCALIHNETNATENLNESILKCVSGRTDWNDSWLADDMSRTLAMLRNGVDVDLAGVTGDWTFDERTHASVLNTTYCHWGYRNGRYVVLGYVSTDGGANTISSSQAWELKNSQLLSFNENQRNFYYPELENKWAVVIGASDDWANYRHQADALAMYQLLKRHGYNDDNIVLIIEDNIAFHPKNIFPGIVKVRPDGENLYKDVKIDYKLSELSFDDLKAVMTGLTTDSTPYVVNSTENDNVIIFWCGHGYPNQLAWGSTDYIFANEIRRIIESMKFRKLFFSLDACYSGSIGTSCEGLPGVIVFTAANPYETSKADMFDSEMGVWLSNGFTRSFQETIDLNNGIALSDLYYKLARETVGSHVMVYNMDCFGNMYQNYMSEFLE